MQHIESKEKKVREGSFFVLTRRIDCDSLKAMKNVISIAVYLRRAWAGVFFFALFCSFTFHLVTGDRGYFSYRAKETLRTEKQAEYAALLEKRQHLEHKVKLMRPDHLDLDLLDEQVREMLRRSGENEFLLP